MADGYRGKYTDKEYTAEELSTKYSDEVKKLCDQAQEQGKGVSCFIAESFQSCGGQIIFPPGYLRQVYE